MVLKNSLKSTIFAAVGLAFAASSCVESDRAMADRVMEVAKAQALNMHAVLPAESMPRSADSIGRLTMSGIEWWCSGFYPGTLWQIYRYTSDPEVFQAAKAETGKLNPLLCKVTDHDIGFQVNCSYGEGLSATDSSDYRRMILAAADTLAARFNPRVGCIRSWNIDEGHNFYVIIDNMMNLELLMEASRLSENDRYKEIAVKHALTTARNHIRPDFSSFHWVIYNDSTGRVAQRRTGQGYADHSTWARGEAWALYGFTMMARHTGDARFLSLAEHIARWVLDRLPDDGVPYWDYTAADSLRRAPAGLDRRKAGERHGRILRDASAAAVNASALLDLADMTSDRDLASRAVSSAARTLHTLASPEYLAEPGTNAGFLLKHSVGNLPAESEVDVPLTYADYYFLEGVNKLVGLRR